MKRLFSANTPADEGTLQLLRAMLEGEAIACMVRNEQLSIAKGDIPPADCIPELWVLSDADYLKARAMMDNWREAGAEPHPPWLCSHCKETNEGQFTSCWKCGNEQAGA